jgi:hypothetical protein
MDGQALFRAMTRKSQPSGSSGGVLLWSFGGIGALFGRDAVVSINTKYTDIERDISRLIEINRGGAQEAVTRIDELKRQSLWLFSALGLAGLGATLFVGRWSRRKLVESEEQVGRYAKELEPQNEALETTSWVRAQHVALSERIQGELRIGRGCSSAPKASRTNVKSSPLLLRGFALLADV